MRKLEDCHKYMIAVLQEELEPPRQLLLQDLNILLQQ